MRSLTPLLLLSACTWVGEADWTAANDRDGDGHLAAINGGDDCDDGDAQVHPGAEERCNGVDDDCDGETDEGVAQTPTWYPDEDGDGYGDGASGVSSCLAPEGWTDDATDCDDHDATIHPEAEEWCDGIDTDCDGEDDLENLVSFRDSEGAYTDVTGSFPSHGIAAVFEFSSDGTLFFCPGSYVGSVTITAGSAAIVGRAGSSATELSGTAVGSVLAPAEGAGDLYVSGITLRDGSAAQGGAISSTISALALVAEDVVIADSGATASGGGIYLQDAATFVANELIIRDCEAHRGGGIHVEGVALDLSYLSLEGNEATELGGGMYAARASGTLSGLTASGNVSTAHGGGLYLEDSVLRIEQALMSGNQAGEQGGGIAITGRDTELALTHSLLENHQAEEGAGLFIDNSTAHCVGEEHVAEGFLGNVASSVGGAVAVTGNAAGFTSAGCDFGMAAQDNLPEDIYTGLRGETFSFDDDVDFECDRDGCW
jgi:hypothetical protein